MKTLNLEEMEKVQSGKFWGTGTVRLCTVNPLGTGDWCRDCHQDYMVWFKVGKPYACVDVETIF